MQLYPLHTTNQNVPKDVFLVAEIERMSEEIKTTYYVTAFGDMFYVGDWTTDKSHPTNFSTLCRLTGDSRDLITGRWRQWKAERSKEC